MTIPLQFVSLYDGQEVFMWSSCLLDLGTDFIIYKRMRKAKSAVKKGRVLLEEVAFERAMYSLPTIRQ